MPPRGTGSRGGDAQYSRGGFGVPGRRVRRRRLRVQPGIQAPGHRLRHGGV